MTPESVAMAEDSALKVAVVSERLEGHERVCAERYSDIKDSFARVHDRLDKIFWGVLGLTVAVLGWLLVNGRPWEKVG